MWTSLYYVTLWCCLSSLAVSVVVLLKFAAVMRRIRWSDRPAEAIDPSATVTAIMPARDEEQDIAAAVESVLRQTGVELQAIVVNDHSSDRTGPIIDRIAGTEPRLMAIHNPPLPAGWLGKSNAMQTAAAEATGEYLLFTDADVKHAPDCCRTALAQMRAQGLDFLSLMPVNHCVSFWESAIAPLFVGGMVLIATPGINDPASPDAVGAGAFLLVRADAFRAAGGFEPIKAEMLDDVSLARLLKSRGRRVRFQAAPDLLSIRMFKGNAQAFWGTTKNILGPLRGRLWLAPGVMLLPIIVLWGPPFAAALGAFTRHWTLAVVGIVTYGVQYSSLLLGRTLFRFNRAKALCFPLSVIPVVCCMVRALYFYVVRGSVFWRGRAIRVRATAPT